MPSGAYNIEARRNEDIVYHGVSKSGREYKITNHKFTRPDPVTKQTSAIVVYMARHIPFVEYYPNYQKSSPWVRYGEREWPKFKTIPEEVKKAANVCLLAKKLGQL